MSIVTVFWNELYVFVYLVHMRVDKVGMYSFEFIYDQNVIYVKCTYRKLCFWCREYVLYIYSRDIVGIFQ